MNAPLLEIRDVRRSFGTITALDGVSLDIRDNEFYALLGPSGCGKTTLLRILAGLEYPDAGTITLEGEDLLAVTAHRRPVNLMFQSYALFPHLTVEKNVAYGLHREKRPKDEIAERVRDALATVDLVGFERRRPNELSGGQRQRVALARAMVKRPRLLLLDEPLAALDRKIRAQMQLELKALQAEAGITFVVVTHDQEEAMSMADRIAVMNLGIVEQIDAPVELYERPRSRFVAEFIGSTTGFEGTVVSDGVRTASGAVVHADPGVLAEGAAAVACIRPEKLELGEAPDGVDHLEGTVLDVQFYGGLSHVAVEVPDREGPVLVALQGSTRMARGERTIMWWRRDDVVVVPA